VYGFTSCLLWLSFGLCTASTTSIWLFFDNGGHQGLFIDCQEIEECEFFEHAKEPMITLVQIMICNASFSSWLAAVIFNYAAQNVGLAKSTVGFAALAAITELVGCLIYTLSVVPQQSESFLSHWTGMGFSLAWASFAINFLALIPAIYHWILIRHITQYKEKMLQNPIENHNKEETTPNRVR